MVTQAGAVTLDVSACCFEIYVTGKGLPHPLKLGLLPTHNGHVDVTGAFAALRNNSDIMRHSCFQGRKKYGFFEGFHFG